MIEKPKPCPMCGGKTDYARDAIGEDWTVFCVSYYCNLYGPVRPTKSKAIQAWNELRRIAPKRKGKA